ncbi:MAG: SDR family NAD(P)-dependent oxidoreductase [Clostridiales bacterium]|nr:SDR family NAD(P)-dependent oxidoreductase [Clostridiales bacterium]
MENLQGKVAFVTGAASGIGLGIAKACGRAGMKVVISDVRRAAIDSVLPFFEKRGWPACGIELDVTDREAYVKAADEAESVFGNIHVLVNNAGVEIPMVPLWECDYRDIDFITGVNFLGVINGIKTIVPRMLKHGEPSHVVSTASQSGVSVVRLGTMYCATKAGVIGMMETVATDLQGTNVGASAFVPGPIKSNFKVTSLEVRPEHLKVEGAERKAPPAPPPPPAGVKVPELEIEAVEAGERVVRGIRRGDLYIVTHNEFKDGVKARADAMLRAYPDEPIDPLRQEFMHKILSFVVKNPIYATQTTPGGPDWLEHMSVYDE